MREREHMSNRLECEGPHRKVHSLRSVPSLTPQGLGWQQRQQPDERKEEHKKQEKVLFAELQHRPTKKSFVHPVLILV
jgi:hypothetical protein